MNITGTRDLRMTHTCLFTVKSEIRKSAERGRQNRARNFKVILKAVLRRKTSLPMILNF